MLSSCVYSTSNILNVYLYGMCGRIVKATIRFFFKKSDELLKFISCIPCLLRMNYAVFVILFFCFSIFGNICSSTVMWHTRYAIDAKCRLKVNIIGLNIPQCCYFTITTTTTVTTTIVTVAIDTNLSNSIDVDVSKPLNHPVSIRNFTTTSKQQQQPKLICFCN